MAKISALPGGTLSDGDLIPTLDGGTTSAVTALALADYVGDKIGAGAGGSGGTLGSLDNPILDVDYPRPDVSYPITWIMGYGLTPANRNAIDSVRNLAAPFDPRTDIGWYASFWADDPDWDHPGNGDPVDEWPDGSGNGRDLVQASGTLQPLYRSSDPDFGSRGVIDFDGVDNILEHTAGIAVSQPSTIVAVIAFNSSVESGTHVFFGGHGGSSFRGIGVNSGAWNMNFGSSDGDPASPPSPGLVYLVRAHPDGASSVFAVNEEVQTGIVSVGGASINQLVLGAGRNSSGPSYTNYTSFRIAFLGAIAGDVADDPMWPSFLTWVEEYYSAPLA